MLDTIRGAEINSFGSEIGNVSKLTCQDVLGANPQKG